ncbi:MAG: LPS assembly protein LptD [Candidatus Latescibacterota bacterium]
MLQKRKSVEIAWILLLLILWARPAAARTVEPVHRPEIKEQIAPPSEPDEGIRGTGAVWTDSVRYAAQSVDYRFDEDTILFSGDAKIQYGKMTLTAEKIALRIDDDMILAEGIPDSTGKPVGTPVFREGTEEIRGLRMTYNVKTKKGTVVSGETAFEKGFYRGERIRQIGEDVLGVSQGTYTTCEKENPHYHFASRRMKVLVNDKVVAKPLIFYVADLPVCYFPFAILPIKKGRHSGILMPRYGSSSYDGRYIRNVGYYMAPSDYWDATAKAGFYEETGWLLESDLRYALRYRFQGSVAGSYKDQWQRGVRVKRRWDLRLSHNQTLDPTLSFRGSANLVSDKAYLRDTGLHPMDRMNRILRSDLLLNKRWAKSGNSLSASLSQSKFLDPPEGSTLDLPRIMFRKSRTPVFKSEKGSTETRDSKWYRPLLYFFNGDLGNTIKRSKTTDSDMVVVTTARNLGISGALELPGSHKALQQVTLSFDGKLRDTAVEEKAENGDLLKTRNLQSGLGLSSSHSVFGWLDLSPKLNLNKTWQEDENRKWTKTNSFSGTASAKTTLYGLFSPHIGALKTVRHVVEPRVSFWYSGMLRQHDQEKWEELKPQRTLDLSLNNILQIKTQKGEKKERKLTLGTLIFSTSYDFEKETRAFSDLRTSLSIKPIPSFDVRFSAQHSLYDQDDAFDPLRLDLKNMSATTSLRFSGGGIGKKPGTSGQPPSSDPFLDREGDSEGRSVIPGLDPSNDGENTSTSGPWQFQLSHYYGITKVAASFRKTTWIKGSLRLNPTARWRVSYQYNYDLERKEMTAHDVSIFRDLHCWQAQIQWTPSGYRKGYYFLLNIKELPDIKIEKKRGRGGFSFR